MIQIIEEIKDRKIYLSGKHPDGKEYDHGYGKIRKWYEGKCWAAKIRNHSRL